MEAFKNSCLKWEPTEDEALEFIKQIKRVLVNDEDGEHRYGYFLYAMEAYKFQRISSEDLLDRAKKIFQRHEVLFSGFKKYLLKGQEIDQKLMLPCTNTNNDSDSESYHQVCKKYMEKIKNRFEHDPGVYYSFLTILKEYRKGGDDILEIYEKVFKLFIGHIDLLEEFEDFSSDLDKDTRGKIEDIKNFIIDDQLSKVQELLLQGSKELELVDRVFKCSDLVSKNDSIKDIGQYFNEDDWESMEELLGVESVKLRMVLAENAPKFFAVVNTSLKKRTDIGSGVRSSKLLFWKKSVKPK